MKRRRRGYVISTALLLLLVVAGVLLIVYLGGEPNTLEVEAAVPPAILVSEPAPLAVTIKNISVDPVTIESIALEDTLMDGLTVVSSDPPYTKAEERNNIIGGNWQQYTLNRTLSPGEEIVVTLMLQGTTPGQYTGDITVWVEDDILGVSLARAKHVEMTALVQ